MNAAKKLIILKQNYSTMWSKLFKHGTWIFITNHPFSHKNTYQLGYEGQSGEQCYYSTTQEGVINDFLLDFYKKV